VSSPAQLLSLSGCSLQDPSAKRKSEFLTAQAGYSDFQQRYAFTGRAHQEGAPAFERDWPELNL
jgi:hypothetical protein